MLVIVSILKVPHLRIKKKVTFIDVFNHLAVLKFDPDLQGTLASFESGISAKPFCCSIVDCFCDIETSVKA